MRTPGFTAEAGLSRTEERYWGGAASGSPAYSGQLTPQLIAPPICRTSPCLTLGRCRTRVRCCTNFLGRCTCTAQPCFIPL
jgi:hypothetical protein